MCPQTRPWVLCGRPHVLSWPVQHASGAPMPPRQVAHNLDPIGYTGRQDSQGWQDARQQPSQRPLFPPAAYPGQGPPPPRPGLPSTPAQQPQHPSQPQKPQPGPSQYTDALRPPWQPPPPPPEPPQEGLWGRLSARIVRTTQSLLESKGEEDQGERRQTQYPPPPPYGRDGLSSEGGRPPYPGAGAGPSSEQYPPPPARAGDPWRGPARSDGLYPSAPGGPQGRHPDARHLPVPPLPPPSPFSPPSGSEGAVVQEQGFGDTRAHLEGEEDLPDVFTVGDNMLLVRDPRGLREKIRSFAQAGSQSLEVLAAFEGGLKPYRAPGGQRTESAEGLVHEAVLMAHTRATLDGLAGTLRRELEAATTEEERHAKQEEFTQKVHEIVAREGQVYLPALPRAVHDFASSVPLRTNLEQTLKMLAFRGVPLTIFCPGYGDVVAHILASSAPGRVGWGCGSGRQRGLKEWLDHIK